MSVLTKHESSLMKEVRALRLENERLKKKLVENKDYFNRKLDDIKKEYADTIISLNKKITLLSKPFTTDSYPEKLFNSILIVTGFTKENLSSSSRKGELVKVRHIFFHILKDKGYSLQKIAYLVNRDHSTVISALKKMKNWDKLPKIYKNELLLKSKIEETINNYENIQIEGQEDSLG